MKKFLCIMLALVFVLSLVACNKDDTDTNSGNNGDAGVTEEQKVEIADKEVTVAKLKCTYTVSGGGERGVIEGKKAAELYSFITENISNPEKKNLDTSGKKNIFLSFQTADNKEDYNIDFLGSYIICENGAVVYTPMDKPNERVYYKFPKGTMDEIITMVTGK